MPDALGIILAINILKYLILFAAPYFIFWVWFPHVFKKIKIQKFERQKPQVFFEIKYSVSTILIQSLLFLSIYIFNEKGYFRIHNEVDGVRDLIAFIAYFLIYDAYFYWSHRLLHYGWLYKNVHVVHHRSLNPTPFASYSFHPFEAVLSILYFYPVLYFFPMSLNLFIVLVILTDIGNLAGHLGYDFVPKFMWKSRWGSWLTTPTHHNMHHQFSKCNYGLYWRGWDEICKTLHAKTEEEFYRVKDSEEHLSKI